MKKFCTTIILLGTVLLTNAQNSDNTFEFRSEYDKTDISNISASSHYLGPNIGKKIALLEQSYTWQEEPTPTSPSIKTVVEKPTIFFHIKKIEKYYKKSVKKGQMSMEDASSSFEKILDIAIQVRYQETVEFENYLQSVKSPEQVVSIFTEKVAFY